MATRMGTEPVEVLQMIASMYGALATVHALVASYGGGSTTSGGSGGSGYTSGGSSGGYGTSYGPVFWISAVVIALVVIGAAVFLWRRFRSSRSTPAVSDSSSPSYRDRAA